MEAKNIENFGCLIIFMDTEVHRVLHRGTQRKINFCSLIISELCSASLWIIFVKLCVKILLHKKLSENQTF
jgi:hypothetical protein